MESLSLSLPSRLKPQAWWPGLSYEPVILLHVRAVLLAIRSRLINWPYHNFKDKTRGSINGIFLLFSCGPTNGGEMVSRRKILSRSRDDLHMEAPPDEEDVWYQKEKLFKVQPNKGNFDYNPLRVSYMRCASVRAGSLSLAICDWRLHQVDRDEAVQLALFKII